MGLKKHLYSLMPQYNPSSLMPQSLVCAKYMNALLILIIQASPKKIVRFGLQVDKANIQKKKDEEKVRLLCILYVLFEVLKSRLLNF